MNDLKPGKDNLLTYATQTLKPVAKPAQKSLFSRVLMRVIKGAQL